MNNNTFGLPDEMQLQYDAAQLGNLMRGGGLQDSSLGKRKSDATTSANNKKAAKPVLTNERREERNAREKDRSLKITTQIHELRNLLSVGGVIVPKGTKSTILAECANYIRLLQQHQVQSEMDKAQLVQEVQRIGNGAIGDEAAYAIRHAASQNGVSSLTSLPDGPVQSSVDPQQQAADPAAMPSDILADSEYRYVFNSCSVGMAIATMGGSFIDCNLAFTQLSSYTKDELKAMTIFNVTSRDDLQGAFDMMSQLITPPGGLDADGNNIDEPKTQSPVILRSAIRHRSDLGLSVSLIRGEDGVARYFNVTLVKLPPSTPMDGSLGSTKPVPATAEMTPEAAASEALNIIKQPPTTQPEGDEKQNAAALGLGAPQYTAG